jgi:hypothetical protein
MANRRTFAASVREQEMAARRQHRRQAKRLAGPDILAVGANKVTIRTLLRLTSPGWRQRLRSLPSRQRPTAAKRNYGDRGRSRALEGRLPGRRWCGLGALDA